MSDAPSQIDRTTLRAEHDALAAKLAARASVDAARQGLLLTFIGILGTGTCAALAWDRWGPAKPGTIKVIPPGGPFFLYVAMLATLVVFGFALRGLARARRLQREEAVQFERMKALRHELGLDG